jgi:magnesium-transporting ATPase (P-type)
MKTDNVQLFEYSVISLLDFGYDVIYKTNDLDCLNEDNIMTSAYFRRISDSSFIARAEDYTLYEGLDTVQKHRLVSLLKQKGECVGYFGNDFEDLATMEEADIGYSSGITLNKGDSVVDLGNERVPIHLQREEEKGTIREAPSSTAF